MRYLSLAAKNLLRRPIRSLLTVLGVALAVAVAVSLIGFNLGYRRSIDESIDKLGFQVMIMAKGCPYEAATLMLKGGTGLLYLPYDTYDKIKTDPSISSITPIFIGIAEKEASGVRDDAAKSFIVMAGIDLESFKAMKPWMTFKSGHGYDGGRWFTSDSQTEIVLGFEIAEYEQRKIGDTYYATITPKGKTVPEIHEFKVVGVLERTGTQDDGTVFMPEPTARKVFNRQTELTIIGVKLKEFNAPNIHKFEQSWVKLPEVQVVSLQQVKTTLVSLVGTAQTMVAAVAIIAVLVAIIGVINTILMSVYERTGEIGIMKAIGAYRGDIFKLIWLETLVVCFSGALLGSVAALLGSRVVEAAITSLIDLGVKGSIVHITPSVIGSALGGAIIVGIFAGLYPGWRAASMRPIEAIREGE